MKALFLAALAATTIASGIGSAMAQDAVPIRPNYRGEPSCPSNYVIQGGACVSIYAGRHGGYGDDGYRRGWRRGYDSYAGDRRALPPRVNYRGELQCPSNYVIRGGACVSLY